MQAPPESRGAITAQCGDFLFLVLGMLWSAFVTNEEQNGSLICVPAILNPKTQCVQESHW